MEALFGYLLLGAGAGVAAGLLGVGGGLIIVPVLLAIWAQAGLDSPHLMQLAIGTSLATIMFTSISSVLAHQRQCAVMWPLFWRLTPGIVLGAWLGAALAAQIPGAWLKQAFGIFELLVAAQMGLRWQAAAHRQLPDTPSLSLAGLLIGGVSAIVGIGGGIMTVPFLVWCRVRMQQAVATSAACGLPIALAGTLGYLVMGWSASGLPTWSVGFVYGPALLGVALASMLFAPLGARLAHRLPAKTLKRVFALFIAALGVWMLSL